MGLRTYRCNFRKNWVLSPSKWNKFFQNLELDMIDLNNEIKDIEFVPSVFNIANDMINIDFGQDSKS